MIHEQGQVDHECRLMNFQVYLFTTQQASLDFA